MDQFLEWLLKHIEENEIFLTKTTLPTRPPNNTTTF
jgi:hypothetical protein